MPQTITLEKFQGPLDLLLQLIEQEQLNITEVSISTVTEQFFKYLTTLENNRSEELADFLIIATKLVYVKSRHLLPYLYPANEDDGPSLADQLKLYKRYAEASKLVEKLWQENKISYGRIEPPLPYPKEFFLPQNVSVNSLQSSFLALLSRLKPLANLPQVTIDHSVSVKHKIEAIYNKIKEFKNFSFNEILKNAESKTEIIVSFLALLELVKQEKISIHQSAAFDDMMIKKT